MFDTLHIIYVLWLNNFLGGLKFIQQDPNHSENTQIKPIQPSTGCEIDEWKQSLTQESDNPTVEKEYKSNKFQ